MIACVQPQNTHASESFSSLALQFSVESFFFLVFFDLAFSRRLLRKPETDGHRWNEAKNKSKRLAGLMNSLPKSTNSSGSKSINFDRQCTRGGEQMKTKLKSIGDVNLKQTKRSD